MHAENEALTKVTLQKRFFMILPPFWDPPGTLKSPKNSQKRGPKKVRKNVDLGGPPGVTKFKDQLRIFKDLWSFGLLGPLGTSRNLGTDDEGPAAMRAMSMPDNQAYWSDTPLHRGWCGGISSTSSAGGCLFVWLFVLYAEIGKDIAEKFVQMLMENRDFWSQNVRKKW